ncbi:protein transporter Sec31, partial [Streptomyces halstedii]
TRLDSPDDDEQPTASGPMTIADAVRTAVSSGITDPDAVLRYVRKVADANAKATSVDRYLRGHRKPA